MSLSQLHDNYCSDVEVLKIVIRNDKRNGLLQSPVGDQKVSVAGDIVGGVPGIRLRGHHLDAVVQLVALASLDEEQLGFAILHQPRPRVLPRCRQLVRKRKRKSKPGKIYQRLLQSKAKQFWYQLAWYQQL